MVKWISQLTSDQLFWVRILVGALERSERGMLLYRKGGHGLVVERVLAKDETGVRFSLPAQYNS